MPPRPGEVGREPVGRGAPEFEQVTHLQGLRRPEPGSVSIRSAAVRSGAVTRTPLSSTTSPSPSRCWCASKSGGRRPRRLRSTHTWGRSGGAERVPWIQAAVPRSATALPGRWAANACARSEGVSGMSVAANASPTR
ncbi:hypothetical protein [Leifsonia sp. P73]|uniref:hypothetical protein n=1 Tax=Leifsonia sp. P73 TaxID=3423959 RepID=UPI003DA6A6E8